MLPRRIARKLALPEVPTVHLSASDLDGSVRRALRLKPFAVPSSAERKVEAGPPVSILVTASRRSASAPCQTTSPSPEINMPNGLFERHMSNAFITAHTRPTFPCVQQNYKSTIACRTPSMRLINSSTDTGPASLPVLSRSETESLPASLSPTTQM